MKTLKSIILIALLFVLIFSTIGAVSAGVVVEMEPQTAHVGDTVTITVSARNTDIFDWYPVVVYASIPNGLQYRSHVVYDKTLQNYNPNTGIWDINRMRHEERGLLKTLIITTKVLPNAAGKTLTAHARFTTLVRERTGESIASEIASSSDSISISATTDNDNEKKPPGGGNKLGNGTGNGSGDGVGSGNSTIGGSNINENSELGGGGTGNTYEILKSVTKAIQDPKNSLFILLGILGIVTLILIGYFKGIRE